MRPPHEFVGSARFRDRSGVRDVAETQASGENAPSHRVYVGRAGIGVARPKRSSEARDYLSLQVDAPRSRRRSTSNLCDDESRETSAPSDPARPAATRLRPKPRLPARPVRAGPSWSVA
uniref:Uncharacterized protein n=1 Tax=Chelativorans sp. (strain BNC1) TaxID=266779 RepID=Q11FU6_CHESB